MTEQIAIEMLEHSIVSYETQNRNNITCDLTQEVLDMAIEALEKQAEYKALEEQGLLLRLPAPLDGVESFSLDGKKTWFGFPCNVGDVLWWIDAYGDLRNSEVNSMFVEQGIDGVIIDTLICNISAKELGKTVFLTKEEAEAALEKMKGGVE